MGHIHVSYDKPNEKTSVALIKAMDLFLGLPSILLDPDQRRKEMYGKAGAFRFKNYGVEYRSLSNFWLQSPELMEWAFKAVEQAVNFVNSGEEFNYPELVKQCINNNDVELTTRVLKKKKMYTKIENLCVV